MWTKNWSYFENAKKVGVGVGCQVGGMDVNQELKLFETKKSCGGGGGGGSVEGGCEPRIGVILKMQKKDWGGGGKSGLGWAVNEPRIEVNKKTRGHMVL